MIHTLLKRKQSLKPAENPPKREFSLGFSTNQSMDSTLEKIIEDITQTSIPQKETIPVILDPHSIPNDRGFNSPPITLPASIFTKKTISKNKTIRGLNNPLKVPSNHQKLNSFSPVILKSSASNATQKNETQLAPPSEQSPIPSFRLPLSQSNSIIQTTRISIAKELLKSAASCQMISIQEAHSMGSKMTLSAQGLMLPLLAELLHRNPESVQKNLLLKINKPVVPIDFFASLIGNQTVQKFHTLLIPYKIIPLFHQGNSLTILAEHPLLLTLAETILKENHSPVAWIHFIPASLIDLESFS